MKNWGCWKERYLACMILCQKLIRKSLTVEYKACQWCPTFPGSLYPYQNLAFSKRNIGSQSLSTSAVPSMVCWVQLSHSVFINKSLWTDLASPQAYQCILLHVEYLNILCRPQISDEDISEVMRLMKEHNTLFVAIYCGNDSSKTFISIFIHLFYLGLCWWFLIFLRFTPETTLAILDKKVWCSSFLLHNALGEQTQATETNKRKKNQQY